MLLRRIGVVLLAASVLAPAGCRGTTVVRTPGPVQPRPPRPVRAARPHRVTGGGRAVPILMYHDVARPPRGAPYPLLYEPPARFRAQLLALRRHGYHAVTLDRLWLARHGRASLPRRPVVLSFDDGFRGVSSAAMPALRAYHWPGVLFLLIRHLDQPGTWDLSTTQVRRLLAAGWELDAHGITEVDLPALPARAARRAVRRSRSLLRRRFGVPVSFFCYPVGAYDTRVERAVRRAGYRGAVTTRPGYAMPGDDPFALPRIRVDGGESARQLLASLRAARR